MIERRKVYSRHEDMSADGKLSLMMEDDGDVIITVQNSQETLRYRQPGESHVQFCTYSGGSRSLRTRNALIALMEAIEADNQEYPEFDGAA